MEKKQKWMSKKKVISLIGILIIVILVAGVSFAVFNFIETGTENSTITTGQLKLVLDDSMGDGISLLEAIPTKDEDGMLFTPYEFTLENVGTVSSYYTISLMPDEDMIETNGALANLLDYSKVKVQLNDETPVLLSELTELQLETGEIKEGEKFSYTLRLWIDWNAGNEIMGQELYMKVKVEGIQGVRTNPLPTPDYCFVMNGNEIEKYDQENTECPSDVVIPSEINGATVTSVGTSAFMLEGSTHSNRGRITSVVIPEGVTTINDDAFRNNNITKVNIPDSVTKIGDYAFSYNEITSLKINNAAIELYAFSNNKIQTLEIGSGVEIVEGGEFSYNKITTLTIPSSLTKISRNAFSNNEINNLTIEEGVEEIGVGAFSDNLLTEVTIPNSVMILENEVFHYNFSLSNIVVKGKNSENDFTTAGALWYGVIDPANIIYQP